MFITNCSGRYGADWKTPLDVHHEGEPINIGQRRTTYHGRPPGEPFGFPGFPGFSGFPGFPGFPGPPGLIGFPGFPMFWFTFPNIIRSLERYN